MATDLLDGISADKILEAKVKGETARAHIAFIDFARLGPKRTIVSLYEMYKTRETEGRKDLVVSRSIDTLYIWRSRYKWNDRVRAYDKLIQNELIERTGDGLGSAYSRIERLTRLADKLENEIFGAVPTDDEELDMGLQVGDGKVSKLWVKETRITSSGIPTTNFTFNTALVAQYRSTIDDIAQEVGGRVPAPLVQVDARQVDNSRRTQQLVILPDKESIQNYVGRKPTLNEDGEIIIDIDPDDDEPDVNGQNRIGGNNAD